MRKFLHRTPLTVSPVFVLVLLMQSMVIFSCAGRSVKPYAHKDISISSVKKVAVLPLQNLTADTFASQKIEGLLIIDFLSRGIDVIEPGEVRSVLRKLKIRSTHEIPVAELQNIAKTIHADAVITGAVGSFTVTKGISVAYPEVSVHFMMIDTLSGTIMWSAWHTSGGPDFWTRHFGAEGETLDEAAREVVKDTLDTLYKP